MLHCAAVFAFVLLALAGAVRSEAASAQSVAVSPGALDLNIPFVTGGYGTVVNTATVLSWTGAQGTQTSKITVGTTAPGQTFTLRVTATAAYQGTPAGTVTLTHGASAADLVRNIPQRVSGLAALRFEAGVPVGFVGPWHQDLHTVVYTITRQ